MVSLQSKQSTAVHAIEPLTDARWGELVQRHSRSSIFHTVPWLKALRRSYGYEVVVYTTTPPGRDLQDGFVFCKVDSWLTGRRLVGLPFSDHCEPLVSQATDWSTFVSALGFALSEDRLDYIEFRPKSILEPGNSPSVSRFSYCHHKLDLAPGLDVVFSHCHKNSTQRKIRRAEREGLTYESGRSTLLLEAFYHLLVLTRRRHGLPPQPLHWFENLIEYCGDALQIRVAFKAKRPVAAILTLVHRDTITYKYGCSDALYNNLGGTHLLMWRTITEARANGLRVLDLGRSEYENIGLLTFKDRWGAERSELRYSRLAPSIQSTRHYRGSDGAWNARMVRRIFSALPTPVLSTVGNLLYRHIG
jgi:CelD/BcsL family acetyltransferase involved in cellulose biosynthesis